MTVTSLGDYPGLDYVSVTAWAAWLWPMVAVCATVLVGLIASWLIVPRQFHSQIAFAHFENEQETPMAGMLLRVGRRIVPFDISPRDDIALAVKRLLRPRARNGQRALCNVFAAGYGRNGAAFDSSRGQEIKVGSCPSEEKVYVFPIAKILGVKFALIDPLWSERPFREILVRVLQVIHDHSGRNLTFGDFKLAASYIGLGLHYAGLFEINADLKKTDYGKYNQGGHFNPMRFGLRFPIAFGWFALFTALWVWCINHGYFWSSLGLLAASLIGAGLIICFSENVSAAPGIDASATCYGGTEYVHVLPVVVPELKFCDVQRHVFGADLVKGADDSTLHQRPKTFNRVGVNSSDNVLVFAVVNHFVRKRSGQIDVTGPRVRSQQADLVGNGFPDKLGYACTIDAFQDASDDFAFALHSADNADLAGAAASPATAALIPVFVFVFPADVSLVNLDNTAELIGAVFAEASTDTVAHVERGFVRAKTHDPLNLQCADSLFAGQHHVDDPEPIAERFIRVFEDGADQNGEAIPARFGALAALPMEGPIGHGINVNIPAARAMNAMGPAAGDEVAFAIVVSREHVVKLLNCKLFYGLCAGHVGLPNSMEATYAI